jgi:hypothetical protein
MSTKQTEEENVKWADLVSDSESDNEESEIQYSKPKTFTKQKSNRIADEILKQETLCLRGVSYLFIDVTLLDSYLKYLF